MSQTEQTDTTGEICPEMAEFQELQESREAFNLLNEQKTEQNTEPKAKRAQIRRTGEVDYLDKKKSDNLLSAVTNIKHKAAILLMMDCGLRATECVTLKMENFDWKKKVVLIRSLKKRGNELVREIPISSRLLETLAEYLTDYKAEKEDYLFPNPSNKNHHVSRKSLNRLCDRLKEQNPGLSELHPHALRHTFATQLLVNGAELHNVKTLLGHQSFNTTLIYNHTPIEILRKNIEDMTEVKRSWLGKLMHRFFGKKSKPSLLNFNGNAGSAFIVGREKELMQVCDNLNKNINTILTGKIGLGKSHILKQIELQGKKILKLDEMANLKLTFVNMLLYLFENDKKAIGEILYSDFDNTKLQQKLQRDSVQSLIEEVLKITGKHEYVLMIDNVDGITPKAMRAIEQLKDHFVIVTTAREIPINRTSFIWNFEHIKIEPLSRTNSLELIHKLSYDIEVEDTELYRNHIYEQSSGNPRVIFELCERYRKESIVTDDIVRQVRHIGGLPEIDMSFIVVIILAGISILRYTSKEFGGESLRFIGGIALVLLMLSRYFLSRVRRKFL
jgi:site-specific recombinase XerD